MVYLHAKSEPDLATYQTHQVGNTCTMHAIAVALHLLLKFEINPIDLSDEVNRLWWRGRFMRIAPDWAVTPRMQVRMVRYLAQKYGLPVDAEIHRGNPDALPELLNDTAVVPIITILWRWRQAPPIYLGNSTLNHNETRSAGGHSMILAAFDPQHTADGQFSTPWGFINPWIDGSNQLFWMADEDFKHAWRFWLPCIGRYPIVHIQSISQ